MDKIVRHALIMVAEHPTSPVWAKSALLEAVDADSLEAGGISFSVGSFDETYIEFLDTMIELGPPGPEWTGILEARRAALVHHVNERLMRFSVERGQDYFTAQCRASDGRVAHVESY